MRVSTSANHSARRVSASCFGVPAGSLNTHPVKARVGLTDTSRNTFARNSLAILEANERDLPDCHLGRSLYFSAGK
jgi:hypothetical protein